MLSSQTKDPVTHQATVNLRNDLPGGLTVEALEKASIEEIDSCIKKVGFHNTKFVSLLSSSSPRAPDPDAPLFLVRRAKNLKLLATRLREHHDGDVPSDLRASPSPPSSSSSTAADLALLTAQQHRSSLSTDAAQK